MLYKVYYLLNGKNIKYKVLLVLWSYLYKKGQKDSFQMTTRELLSLHLRIDTVPQNSALKSISIL